MTRPHEPSTDSDFADAAFSSLEKVQPSAELSRNVAQIPVQHEKSGTLLFWPFPSAWQPSVALAAAALFGVLSGNIFDANGLNNSTVAEVLATQQSTGPTDSALETTAPAAQQASADQAGESLEELFAVALGDTWQEADWEALDVNHNSEAVEEVTQ